MVLLLGTESVLFCFFSTCVLNLLRPADSFVRFLVVFLVVGFRPSPPPSFPPALQKDCERAERQPSLKPEVDERVGIESLTAGPNVNKGVESVFFLLFLFPSDCDALTVVIVLMPFALIFLFP